MNAAKILNREERLLKWESYLRRTRAVAAGLSVIAVISALYAIPSHEFNEIWNSTGIWQSLLILALAYEAHLKILHIESIKYHRANPSL